MKWISSLGLRFTLAFSSACSPGPCWNCSCSHIAIMPGKVSIKCQYKRLIIWNFCCAVDGKLSDLESSHSIVLSCFANTCLQFSGQQKLPNFLKLSNKILSTATSGSCSNTGPRWSLSWTIDNLCHCFYKTENRYGLWLKWGFWKGLALYHESCHSTPDSTATHNHLLMLKVVCLESCIFLAKRYTAQAQFNSTSVLDTDG